WLADRVRRVPIVGVASILGAFFTALSGFAVNSFMFFWTICATGISKANNIAVHPPLIADNYPIGIRARMSAVINLGTQILGNVTPLLVAVVATAAGGPSGWRWSFVILGLPAGLIAIGSFFMREPPRGQYEQRDVLGEVIEDSNPAHPSMEAAFA